MEELKELVEKLREDIISMHEDIFMLYARLDLSCVDRAPRQRDESLIPR